MGIELPFSPERLVQDWFTELQERDGNTLRSNGYDGLERLAEYVLKRVRLANDDPGADPVGTQRKSPDGVEVIRIAWNLVNSNVDTPAWFIYTEVPTGTQRTLDNQTVKGWERI